MKVNESKHMNTKVNTTIFAIIQKRYADKMLFGGAGGNKQP